MRLHLPSARDAAVLLVNAGARLATHALERLDARICRAANELSKGCDCTELCSMGRTCPGGMLAGLPGSGCWRSDPSAAEPTERVALAIAGLVETDHRPRELPTEAPGDAALVAELRSALRAHDEDRPQQCGHSSDPMCCPFENFPLLAGWFTEVERERGRAQLRWHGVEDGSRG